MDGRRFDGLARILSGATDRRGVLRAFAAVLLAAWGNHRALDAATAQDRFATRCVNNADCRASVTDDCIRAHCWRGRCAYAAIRCAGGYHCCGNGRCCEDAPPPPGCVSDADCASDDPCMLSRCENGLCVSMIVDCAPGFVCCGNAECCPAT